MVKILISIFKLEMETSYYLTITLVITKVEDLEK